MRLDAAHCAVEADVEVAVPAATQPVERDRGDPVAAEGELDQVEIVGPAGAARTRHAAADRRGFLTEEVATKVERMRAEFLSGPSQFGSAPARFGRR